MTMKLATSLELELAQRLETRARLALMLKEIQAQLDTENEAIKDYMIEAELQTLAAGGYTASLSVQTRQSLDKVKLVDAGVTIDQIKVATTTTTFAKLDVRKQKEEGQ